MQYKLRLMVEMMLQITFSPLMSFQLLILDYMSLYYAPYLETNLSRTFLVVKQCSFPFVSSRNIKSITKHNYFLEYHIFQPCLFPFISLFHFSIFRSKFSCLSSLLKSQDERITIRKRKETSDIRELKRVYHAYKDLIKPGGVLDLEIR